MKPIIEVKSDGPKAALKSNAQERTSNRQTFKVIRNDSRGEAAAKEMVKRITQSLVDSPEKVNVTVIHSKHLSVFEVSVGKGEAGQVIGRQGRTIAAMRKLLGAMAKKYDRRMVLEILD